MNMHLDEAVTLLMAVVQLTSSMMVPEASTTLNLCMHLCSLLLKTKII
jgi:hypothetical protein